jgi:hypothetical protein
MSYARAAATVFAAFLLANVFAIVIHGFVLAADYEPYRGTLLRDFAKDQGGRRCCCRWRISVSFPRWCGSMDAWRSTAHRRRVG